MLPVPEIYRRPASTFVADFIGRANFIDAELLSAADGWATVHALRRELRVPCHPDVVTASSCVLLLRPESVRVARDDQDEAAVHGDHGRVLSTVFYGQNVEYEIETEVGNVVAQVAEPAQSELLPVGASARITFDPARAWLLPQQGE
jgi:iron(III) transport system ATP-binding protein